MVPPVYNSAASSSFARGTIDPGAADSNDDRATIPSAASPVDATKRTLVDPVHRLADLVHELRRRDHGGRLGVGDDVRERIGWQQEHRRGDDRAGAPDRVVDDPDLGAVRHRDDDTVTRLHAELGEAGRDPAGTVEQLAGCVPLTLEQQRRIIAAQLERKLREPGEVVIDRSHSRDLTCGEPRGRSVRASYRHLNLTVNRR